MISHNYVHVYQKVQIETGLEFAARYGVRRDHDIFSSQRAEMALGWSQFQLTCGGIMHYYSHLDGLVSHDGFGGAQYIIIHKLRASIVMFGLLSFNLCELTSCADMIYKSIFDYGYVQMLYKFNRKYKVLGLQPALVVLGIGFAR